MSLQVWLPLNGNLNNYGLSNVPVTNSGATVNDYGKIGQCYSFNGSNSQITIGYLNGLSSEDKSVSMWVKPNGANDSKMVFRTTGTSPGRFYLGIKNGTWNVSFGSTTWIYTSAAVVDVDNWQHIAVTIKNNVASVYLNGVFSYSKSNTSFVFPSNLILSPESYRFNGLIADVRIYDHCLSAKEVKEISKCLLQHYKFDLDATNPINSVNLVKNGWGGTANWNSAAAASAITDDLPDVLGITHAYTNGNYTKEFIELNKTHRYKLSAYIKKGSTGSTSYLSIIPYDIDKLRIYRHMTALSFRAGSLTTLAQDLSPGDTIIYLTSASGWSTTVSSGTRAAIFGYADSTGYVYPDLVYTRKIYTIDQKSIDTVNNTVQLTAAYSGETIPAGTSICQTVYNTGYYYIKSASSSTLSDWTFWDNIVFYPATNNYLKAAKYIRIFSLNKYQLLAGITLNDISSNDVIYDCSGYMNDCIPSGQLCIYDNSPRYLSCINSPLDGHMQIPMTNMQEFTYSFWVKRDRVSHTEREFIMTGWYGLSFELNTNNTFTFRHYLSSGIFDVISTSLINDTTKWYHICVTRNSSGVSNIYINGVLDNTGTNSNSISYDVTTATIFKYNKSDSYYFNGSISDFRVYGTALSEDDIKELYDTAAIIDNGHNMHCYEFVEDDVASPMIEKNGLVKTNEFNEYPDDYIFYDYIESTGTQWIDTEIKGETRWVGCAQSVQNTTKSQTLLITKGGGSVGTYYGSVGNGNKWTLTGSPYSTDYDVTSKQNFDILFKTTGPSGTIGDTSVNITQSCTLSTNWIISCERTTKYQYIGKIWGLKAYQQEVLVRNLVPAKRKSDNEIGMYDMITGRFFGNSGSGAFTTGTPMDVAAMYEHKIDLNQLLEI